MVLMYDWASLKKKPALKGISVAFSFPSVALAASFLILEPVRFSFPAYVRIAGAAASVFFLTLTAISLFVEIPLFGMAKGAGGVVTTGTYSLTRHPGVLWLFAAHLSLVAASASRPLLLALPFWTAANAVVASIEDRFFFPRMFGPPYLEYRKSVPFLLPTIKSARNCVNTFRITPKDYGRNRKD
jgi:protein-S-isoprenylcysteine O-methyltransferase Ste14